MPISKATVAIRRRVLMVFHRSRWEHPLRSLGFGEPASSSAVYLKSEALKRSDKFEGTRGMILSTIVERAREVNDFGESRRGVIVRWGETNLKIGGKIARDS